VPRPRTIAAAELTQGQAKWVVEQMIRERRVSPGEIQRYVSDMGREINDLERRLASLRAAQGGVSSSPAALPLRRRPGRPPRVPVAAVAPAAGSAEVEAAKPRRGRRRRTPITAEQLASRQLQGHYLALIRQIPQSRRAQYKRIARESGREAAIKDMRDVLHK
jgi:hypothetical protein